MKSNFIGSCAFTISSIFRRLSQDLSNASVALSAARLVEALDDSPNVLNGNDACGNPLHFARERNRQDHHPTYSH